MIDLEWGWNFSHEDLLQNQGGIVGGTGAADTDHGTCVIGEISGDHNGLGVMGIAPSATIMAVAFSMASATAIRTAADRFNAGDVILLEIHRPGPRFSFQARSDQRGYIAISGGRTTSPPLHTPLGKASSSSKLRAMAPRILTTPSIPQDRRAFRQVGAIPSIAATRSAAPSFAVPARHHRGHAGVITVPIARA